MRIIPIFIPHLGCPNDCVFCNQRHIAAPHVPSAGEVAGQIAAALVHSPGAQIAFYGGSFTAIDRQLQLAYLQAAHGFIQTGQACDIRISTRPDCIDGPGLNLLRTHGVSTIELGAQSMCDAVLLASHRGHTAADVEQAAQLVGEYGFQLGLQQMIGLPGDTPELAVESAHRLAALGPDFVRIYPVCVIADTPLADQMAADRYTPLTIEQAVEQAAAVARVYQGANIPIIRIGLNPTEDLSGGAVLAGAYHPALGEMVYSHLLHGDIDDRLAHVSPESAVTIAIHPKDQSLFRGQKNRQYNRLLARYPNITVVTDGEIPRKNVKISVK